MKVPNPAPSLLELFGSHPSDLSELLMARVDPEINGAYEHWDTLRHRTPPNGWSSEQWWLAIKLARGHLARPIPLTDKEGKFFQVSVTDTMQRRLHYIDREAAGAIQGMDRRDGAQERYLIRSLIEEAMTSSQLEGAATTRAVAKEMLATGRGPRDHGEQMIYNNYAVMTEIKAQGRRPFTPETVMEIHRMLTADTLESADHCGRLRTAADDIVVTDGRTPSVILHVPPSASELPARLQRLCDFANREADAYFLHPVVRAIAIHFQMGYDHPFCDENGRTARILFYWSMVNSGYWMTEYLSISSVLKKAPAKYTASYLHTETDNQDLSYFVAYQLEVIEKSIAGLHGYIARKAAENRRADELLRTASTSGHPLNYRQRALLTDAIHNLGRVYTVTTHQAAHRVSNPTAQSDLRALEQLGLLRRERVGKANCYWARPDLATRLGIQ